MKFFQSLSEGVGFCVLLSILATSCVNHITDEDDSEMNSGNIPLKFVANIQEATNTRVAGTEFETGDEVGLFALAGSTTMKEERYVDNLHFVNSAGGELVSNESVYYPDDGVTLNLISYYPYQKEGVEMGESSMKVSVAPDQNVLANYSHSDFLIATKDNVQPSKEAISLTYKHKFFKLKIALEMSEGESVETILAADPKISVSGFYTKTIYDFQDDSFSQYSEEKEITPAGEWKSEGNRLVGKELILIPQEATVGYQYVTLEVGGKTYSSLLPSSLKLQNGKRRELVIAFKSDEDILMSKVNGNVEDWEGNETDLAESETIHKYVDISKLTFEQSSVYKVLHAGKKVAEICKEYLVTPDFSSQAIVAYPMKTDNHNVDLSKGLVVQLIGQSGKVHGGSVSWNMEDHSLTYTPGIMATRNYLYILADGKVAVSISKDDVAQSVLAISDIARDVRGGVIHNYPIVKIGTQYWTREDLKTSLYNDGEKIPKVSVMAENATGYVVSEAGNYFYSTNAVATQKLPISGWGIPKWDDWGIMKKYLKEDAALIKAGTWRLMKDETVLSESNNKSGFNAIPIGMCWASYNIPDYEGRYLGYWTLNETGTTVDQYLLLKSNNNDMAKGTLATDKAFAVRCIRKP